MAEIPREDAFDSTSTLLEEGYDYIRNRCDKHNSDLFKARLMLGTSIFMRGEEAARLFYNNDRFKRKGATPLLIRSTLFGFGGVQGLDGGEHWNRKQMFMSLMTGQNILELYQLVERYWERYVRKWQEHDRVVFFHEIQKLLCEAICDWTGVPLEREELDKRASQLGDLVEAPGSVGMRFWEGRSSRKQTEQWMAGLVKEVRRGRLRIPEQKALAVIARHTTTDEEKLTRKEAAVEMLNILRPTVAIARYIIFAALALHHYPETAQKIKKDREGTYLEWFTQEVRRFYPFFPFVAARVKKNFEWNGFSFARNTRVILDLYGTNHDERIWDRAEEFRPERFRGRVDNAFDFIPQGGGDHHKNHRCPGEYATVDLIKTVTRLLTDTLSYKVPPQDLTIDLSRIPAIPESRFIIGDVHYRSAGSCPGRK